VQDQDSLATTPVQSIPSSSPTSAAHRHTHFDASHRHLATTALLAFSSRRLVDAPPRCNYAPLDAHFANPLLLPPLTTRHSSHRRCSTRSTRPPRLKPGRGDDYSWANLNLARPRVQHQSHNDRPGLYLLDTAKRVPPHPIILGRVLQIVPASRWVPAHSQLCHSRPGPGPNPASASPSDPDTVVPPTTTAFASALPELLALPLAVSNSITLTPSASSLTPIPSSLRVLAFAASRLAAAVATPTATAGGAVDIPTTERVGQPRVHAQWSAQSGSISAWRGTAERCAPHGHG
jgi:hypothetical protein